MRGEGKRRREDVLPRREDFRRRDRPRQGDPRHQEAKRGGYQTKRRRSSGNQLQEKGQKRESGVRSRKGVRCPRGGGRALFKKEKNVVGSLREGGNSAGKKSW